MGGYSTKKEAERAIVVGIELPQQRDAENHIKELRDLAWTAGAEVVAQVIQKREKIEPRTIVGAGKITEIAQMVQELECQLVIFDEELTGSQAKTIEAEVKCKVLDRSGLILDIFARNVRTAESRIQVEVAQLNYLMPRLTRAWTHLSRQVGGIGTRGPGETQLEVDRRLVRKRIGDLKKKLLKMESIRAAQHTNRIPTFHISLVGYTNAGKSTLMNLLTGSSVLVENKLFATLDATTRKIVLQGHQNAVLSDTVGFIRKLPHHLVESFKSTLSVVKHSSCIVQVIDVSDESYLSQMEVTNSVLSDLGVDEIPRILAFNKVDMLEEKELSKLKLAWPKATYISALKNSGIEDLKKQLSEVYAGYSFHIHKPQPKTPSVWP